MVGGFRVAPGVRWSLDCVVYYLTMKQRVKVRVHVRTQ